VALILRTYVYGFGSYFKKTGVYQDIDILIVHTSTDYISCLEAIYLKKIISQEIEKAGISILSKSAELEFNFIEKSQAILLIEFEGDYREPILTEILHKVHTYKKT